MHGELMSGIDSDKWLEVMKSKMDSIGSNQVWILVDLPKEEEIHTEQPKGFTFVEEEQNVHYKVHLWPQTSFPKLDACFDPCVYKKISGSLVAYLVLCEDNSLLIGNDVKMLGDTKAWLSTQFSMKDMNEASYILGIKIYQDRSRRMLGMT
ncbi:hypothetical protein Sango_2327600 [Sesamum angolense]|uniref:Uncharacterized protein n=1 Tax=Sesamum angolense TaxID=2727404 RepID=A0AAE1WAS3_9LAMI|nr:hypothetical protein Sango_2327600 [Sesamum angolense]